MLDHFWDHDNGGLFTTADDGEQLVARQKDLLDNATPSANSTAAVALVPARRAHRRRPLRATTPTRSSASLGTAPCRRRRARSPRPRRGRPARRRHHRGGRRRRSPRSGGTPCSGAGSPTPCWRGASPTTRPLWDGREPRASRTSAATTRAAPPRRFRRRHAQSEPPGHLAKLAAIKGATMIIDAPSWPVWRPPSCSACRHAAATTATAATPRPPTRRRPTTPPPTTPRRTTRPPTTRRRFRREPAGERRVSGHLRPSSSRRWRRRWRRVKTSTSTRCSATQGERAR